MKIITALNRQSICLRGDNVLIFKNTQLYNVSELAETENGFEMLRIPREYEARLSEKGQQKNRFSSGCEIRFVCLDDSGVKVKLHTCDAEFAFVYVYYGSIGAGWQECRKIITNDPDCTFTVAPPPHPEIYSEISRENGFAFSPRVVRIILPNTPCIISDICGKCRPPEREEVPAARYLAYGSSITHGSLSLIQMNSYASRTAENLKADLINLGFAGSACLEKEMADYIAGRDDWDFATLEMGVNVIGMPFDEFKNRAEYFIKTVANTGKKVFCIDLFYLYAEPGSQKENYIKGYRSIVKEAAEKLGHSNVIYLNGEKLLSIGSAGLSGDLTHPNIRGCECIAENLTDEIRKYL